LMPWASPARSDDDTWDERVEDARLPVLVNLSAPWSGPARIVSAVLESLGHVYAGRIKVVTINIETAPRIARRFAVHAIPTLLVIHRGEVLARRTGTAPEPELRSWLDRALTSVPEKDDKE
jgi:thioredoxin 2